MNDENVCLVEALCSINGSWHLKNQTGFGVKTGPVSHWRRFDHLILRWLQFIFFICLIEKTAWEVNHFHDKDSFNFSALLPRTDCRPEMFRKANSICWVLNFFDFQENNEAFWQCSKRPQTPKMSKKLIGYYIFWLDENQVQIKVWSSLTTSYHNMYM